MINGIDGKTAGPITGYLERLRNAANDSLKFYVELYLTQKAPLDKSVNWMNLQCTEAEWYIAHDGIQGARIYVSEASPDGAVLLKLEMRHELQERGFPDVEVITEW